MSLSRNQAILKTAAQELPKKKDCQTLNRKMSVSVQHEQNLHLHNDSTANLVLFGVRISPSTWDITTTRQ